VFPVTQEQWQPIMGGNPSVFKRPDRPVEMVSHDDAVAYCRKLTARLGRPFRLPTEAEWEHACRAGTTTPFHFGDTIGAEQANYDASYVYGRGKKGIFRQQTTPVGLFAPNALGLHDMHGNVWEWCADWYGSYAECSTRDPKGVDLGNERVLRGGAWPLPPRRCRSAYRLRSSPGNRYQDFGLRVALTAG
jgi:formylglycine-generating enzyme required for sulfatase activity